jgi:hypothetical protein
VLARLTRNSASAVPESRRSVRVLRAVVRITASSEFHAGCMAKPRPPFERGPMPVIATTVKSTILTRMLDAIADDGRVIQTIRFGSMNVGLRLSPTLTRRDTWPSLTRRLRAKGRRADRNRRCTQISAKGQCGSAWQHVPHLVCVYLRFLFIS